MIIEPNKVVSFHYKLSEPGLPLIEDSHEDQPFVYLHGHGGVIAGLANALQGKQAGDQFSVTLAPEEAYGVRKPDAMQRVSKGHVIGATKKTQFKPGMFIQLNGKDGSIPAVVMKVGLKTIDVDVNHPLASKTLQFDIEVVDVRDATADELTHGHAHGIGGVQH